MTRKRKRRSSVVEIGTGPAKVRLYTINRKDGYEALVKRLRDNTDSDEDLAVKILIHAPEIAWREFDRQALQAKRSLVSFSSNPAFKFLPPNSQRVAQLESLLGPWFEEDGNPSSKILRPERVDVAHYRHLTGEWQISGIGRRIQDLYRQAFGTVFHASPHALVHSKRYSLEPLREGPSILKCDPAARVQHASLAALKVELPSGNQVLVTRGDIFQGLAEMNPLLIRAAVLLEARLDLKIAARRQPVPVILNPLRDKICGLHLDPAIEPWLAERGFSNQRHETFFLESA